MKSLAFPDMFKGADTQVYSGKLATVSNLKLLLKSYKNSLFGDPYYGTELSNILFEQNNYFLVDVIKDEIYNDIVEFMPLLKVSREGIQLLQDNTSVFVNIVGTNILDGTTDLYSIRLIENDETT